MPESPQLSLPSKKDWAWVLGLILIGGCLGFGLNALSPVGINLTIALDLDSPAPAEAKALSPTAGAAAQAAPSTPSQAKP